MSKVLVSVSLLSSGVGNGRGAGGVAEGMDWGEGEIFGSRVLDSTFPLSSGVGNGRGAGSVSEGGDWGEGPGR